MLFIIFALTSLTSIKEKEGKSILYFDLITFTTSGYGDIHPTGWLKIYAGFEGFAGVLLMSLLLLTAAKKVLW